MHQIFPQHVNTISKNKSLAQGEEFPAGRLGVDDKEILLQRITEVGRVVANYAQRYGLTNLARKTMLKVTATRLGSVMFFGLSLDHCPPRM